MFNIGPGEMIVIGLVLLIAVGPEQLPGVIRRVGRTASQVRNMTEGLRTEFMAGLEEIEQATDVNDWAASANPSVSKQKAQAMKPVTPPDDPDDSDRTDNDQAADQEAAEAADGTSTTNGSSGSGSPMAPTDATREDIDPPAVDPAPATNGSGPADDTTETPATTEASVADGEEGTDR